MGCSNSRQQEPAASSAYCSPPGVENVFEIGTNIYDEKEAREAILEMMPPIACQSLSPDCGCRPAPATLRRVCDDAVKHWRLRIAGSPYCELPYRTHITGGVRRLEFLREDMVRDCAILFVHGNLALGQFEDGGRRGLGARLAEASRVPVHYVEYASAPLHEARHMVRDCTAACRALCDTVGGRRVAVVAEGAGAALVLAALPSIAKRLACCVLVSPHVRTYSGSDGAMTQAALVLEAALVHGVGSVTAQPLLPQVMDARCLERCPPLLVVSSPSDPAHADAQQLVTAAAQMGLVHQLCTVAGAAAGAPTPQATVHEILRWSYANMDVMVYANQ